MATKGNLTDPNEFGYYLPNDKKRILSTLISSTCTVLAAGEARLLVAPTPNSSRWDKRERGIACFVKDNTRRKYFIRIYDLERQRMCFEQRIFKSFEYEMSTKFAFFHTFHKDDGCQVGLKFTDSSAAEWVGMTIEEKLWERKLKDPRNLDPDIKTLLRSVGVTEADYNDRDTRIFIFKFINRMKASNETTKNSQVKKPRTTVPNRPLPAIPHSEKSFDNKRPSLIQYDDLPPPVPDRPGGRSRAPLPVPDRPGKRSSAPLPEQPLSSISRKNSVPLETPINIPDHPPPPVPTVSHNNLSTLPPDPQPLTPPRKPIKREPPPQPQPPPLLERKPTNEAPSPRGREGNKTPSSASAPSQPPPAPPPSPPQSSVSPSIVRSPPSIPPSPPPQPSVSLNAAPSSLSDNQPRVALLAEIIRGIQLNPVTQPSENSSKQSNEDMNPFFSALQIALKQRERVIQDNGELSSDEEDDAAYWSD